MRTVFLGTSQFAVAVLERLAAGEHRPVLVITRPDRPRGRGRSLSAPPVAEAARELGLVLAQPPSVNDTAVRRAIAGTGPGAVIVCAFGALIREPLLSEHEILNVHPSLLPRWRGAAPVERAIMAGDAATGVSIMRLVEGLDSGPVCLSQSLAIEPHDTFGTLSERLQALGGELLVRALDAAARGRPLAFAEQPEEGVTYAEKIGPQDRLLSASAGALELERRVRALDPHIGAQIALGDELMRVRRARALDGGQLPAGALAPAGALVRAGERLLFGAREGVLELLEVQPAGGRPMEAAAFLRGRRLPGEAPAPAPARGSQ